MDETNTSPKKFLDGFLKWQPLVQWILTIAIAGAVFALSQRDSATAQAMETKDNARKINALEIYVDKSKEERTKQIEQMRREILTKEVFEAYRNSDIERMNRMEKLIEQILANQNR